MRIIQFGLTVAALILEEQIKYLLYDVVGISGDFFIFRSEVLNSISLVLDHAECFVSLTSTWLSLVCTMSYESIFQTSFCSKLL